MARCSLYRYFDASGGLLYLGITAGSTRRMHQHAATAPWWPLTATCAIEHHQTRAGARAAELAAIAIEDPPWNVEGTGRKQVAALPPMPDDPFEGIAGGRQQIPDQGKR